VEGRVALAGALWATDIHEARVLAAKLLTQARLRPSDASAWEMIKSWVPEFDAWAIADHACMAGQKRLVWELRDTVLGWAATYVEDHTWFVQKAVAWWLRDLSKHDPDRVRAFLDAHGAQMKPFAVTEAARKLV